MASSPITSWQIDGETMKTVRDFIFRGSKITADGVCSHEIKGCLLLGRIAMTNLDSILKSRDITLSTKVHLVKAVVLLGVMYRCESWTQLLHPYMTTGKKIALTRWTFVGKVMSQLFIMLSRLVIAILPRSKCLLISWLQSPSAVILEPKKINSLTVSIVSPTICHEVMGLDAMILVF